VGADPDSGAWRIGNYQLEEILKAGGMGVVYRATDISREVPRVVKVIAGEQALDPSFRGRFLREMKILRRLKHPHILEVLDSGEWNKTLFIAMPYIEGGDLSAVLRSEGRLEPPLAVNLLAQLAEAVDTAHRARIVHRDIKPANILVDREPGAWRVLLCDFGIAKTLDSTRYTPTGLGIGTPAYMAPEAHAAGPVSFPADIYALGGCLYSMLTGLNPPLAVPLGSPAPAPEFAPSLQDPHLAPFDTVIEQAMAQRQDARFPTAAALSEASKQALDGGTAAPRLSARRPQRSRQVKSPTRTVRPRSYQRNESLPHIGVGAIGHAGHGKTTLTAAITKLLAAEGKAETRTFDEINRGMEEKERGITITTARVEYETEKRRYTLFDCPEYTDYIKNLITGSVTMHTAIVVVSMADGVMPETWEHLRLVRKIGIERVAVFMNMEDLVPDEELQAVCYSEVGQLLRELEFPEPTTPLIAGSALGALEGVEKDQRSIRRLIKELDNYVLTPISPLEKPFLMPIEDIFPITGRGTVATGRIEQGIVGTGEEVEIVGLRPGIGRTTITGIEMFRKLLDQGQAGDNIGALLRGTKREDIERGQVLCKPGSITPHTKFKAEVYCLKKEEGGRHTPFFSGYRPQFYFRTTDVTGIANLPEGTEMVMPGDNVEMTIELIQPIAMDQGLRFAIREGGRTVGSGVVSRILD